MLTIWRNEQTAFSDQLRGGSGPKHLAQVTEAIMAADWAKGRAGGYGAAQYDGVTEVISPLHFTGGFAESWEIVGNDTIIYHIRKGNRWALDPKSKSSQLVGGREANAYDAEFTYLRGFGWVPKGEPGYLAKPYSQGRLLPEEWPLSIKATDKWTLEIKGSPATLGSLFKWTAQSMRMHPPEVLKNFDENNPMNHVGTGPFILTDYVPGSSMTFRKNPTYWRKDPVGPGKGNQLPYIDTLRWLYIQDRSTQMAALRTAKIDHLGERDGLTREEAMSLLKANPQLQSNAAHRRGSLMAWRVDKPELPWYDVRVRQALFMAIDRETIVKDYYGGEADLYSYPTTPDRMFESLGGHIPFDKLPASAQEFYKYDPDKAKKLLAEAGYSNGFKMELILEAGDVDEASLVKFYLAKVGVQVELAVKERGVFTSISTGRTHKDAIWTGVDTPYGWQKWRPTDSGNLSMIDDPVLNQAIAEFAKYFMLDDAKAYPVYGSVVPRMIEQAYYLPLPSPYSYTVWWSWLKGYRGEYHAAGNSDFWTQYVWIDQKLKKSMGY
ncbi:MAG: ABC transporter substrate-binding protein [Chloroflexi bacterium]|nr:ABC transporter substrate-binding protein [Chloroflexota bacterium]